MSFVRFPANVTAQNIWDFDGLIQRFHGEEKKKRELGLDEVLRNCKSYKQGMQA